MDRKPTADEKEVGYVWIDRNGKAHKTRAEMAAANQGLPKLYPGNPAKWHIGR